MYQLIETHSTSAAPGERFHVVDDRGDVVAQILRPGLGNNRYGLYLPALSEEGSPCYRLQGAYPGTWYATAAEALAAMPSPDRQTTMDQGDLPSEQRAYRVHQARQAANQRLYRPDNTTGYTQAELDTLNEDFLEKMAAYITSGGDLGPDAIEAFKKRHADDVARR